MMWQSLKNRFLNYSVVLFFACKLIFVWRKTRSFVVSKNPVSRFLAFSIVRAYKPKKLLLEIVIANSKLRTFLIGKTLFSRLLFDQFKKASWKSDKAVYLYHLANMYRLKRNYEEAFCIFYYLFRKRNNMKKCLRAMACEVHVKDKKLYQYYLSNRESLPNSVALIMDCEYSQHYQEVSVCWGDVKSSIEQDFFPPLIKKSLLAALASKNIDFIAWVESEALNRLTPENKEDLRKIFTMVAACYYRTGRLSDLQRLGRLIDYPNSDWKLYMSFGAHDLMKVMKYRGEMIKRSFMLYYPASNISHRKQYKSVLVPEKDLCGEAFNSLYYSTVYKFEGGFTVVCDSRLYDVMTSNFPYLDFIPKIPRNLVPEQTDRFDELPLGLSDYLDNFSYKSTLGSDFFNINYDKYFSSEDCQKNRLAGWLIPDKNLADKWKEKLSEYSGKKLVGICANSTVRSRIRDIHMVSIDLWGDIFSLEGCVFINLNAAFHERDCDLLSKRFNATFYSPEFDLYNDFNNLLALMSVLDYGVLPANNLMDFAAAVGLKSVVLSPSNIMRSWTFGKDRSYVFSDNIRFALPSSGDSDDKELVLHAAELIKKGFY